MSKNRDPVPEAGRERWPQRPEGATATSDSNVA